MSPPISRSTTSSSHCIVLLACRQHTFSLQGGFTLFSYTFYHVKHKALIFKSQQNQYIWRCLQNTILLLHNNAQSTLLPLPARRYCWSDELFLNKFLRNCITTYLDTAAYIKHGSRCCEQWDLRSVRGTGRNLIEICKEPIQKFKIYLRKKQSTVQKQLNFSRTGCWKIAPSYLPPAPMRNSWRLRGMTLHLFP